MNHTQNYEGVKIDIQTIGIAMNEHLEQQLQKTIKKLKRFLPEVNWIDVYFKRSNKHSTDPRRISMRFGIPGPDVIASDEGYSWKTMLKNIERKLLRQLKKRKAIAGK